MRPRDRNISSWLSCTSREMPESDWYVVMGKDKKPKLLERMESKITDYVKPEKDKRRCLTKLTSRFGFAAFILSCYAIFQFIILAYIASTYSYYDMIGPGILVSRGAASALLALLGFNLLFVSNDLLTFLWGKVCRSRCAIFFDQKIWLHRFCGFSILFYSIMHVAGHLTGSIRSISTHSKEEVNEVLMWKKFGHDMSYF